MKDFRVNCDIARTGNIDVGGPTLVSKAHRGLNLNAPSPIEGNGSRHIDRDARLGRKSSGSHRAGIIEIHGDGITGAINLLNNGSAVTPHRISARLFDVSRKLSGRGREPQRRARGTNSHECEGNYNADYGDGDQQLNDGKAAFRNSDERARVT